MENPLVTAREKTVLRALYANGQLSIKDLSKATLVNRTTLYPILEKMLQRGLVTTIKTEGKTYYEAISTTELEEWARRKQKETNEEVKKLTHWARQTKESKHDSFVAEIKYFDGLEGIMNLYNDTWRENQEKIIYALTDYERAYNVVGDAFLHEDYFKRRVAHGVKVKSLLPDSKIGRKDVKYATKLLREMRFIDLFQDLGIEINIYDNKIALFSFDPKKPSGLLIKNPTIARAFKHIFNYLWKNGLKP